MRQNWEIWMTSGHHIYTKGGKMRKKSLTEVADWWNKVKIISIILELKEVSIIGKNADLTENSVDDSDSDDSDKIDKEFLELFDSASEESDFEGFILQFCLFLIIANILICVCIFSSFTTTFHCAAHTQRWPFYKIKFFFCTFSICVVLT